MFSVSLACARLSERVWYFTVEQFVPVPQDNWEVLIGQSGQQCKFRVASFILHHRDSNHTDSSVFYTERGTSIRTETSKYGKLEDRKIVGLWSGDRRKKLVADIQAQKKLKKLEYKQNIYYGEV